MGHNANCVNPDETPHNVASGQGLHFLLTECHVVTSYPSNLFEQSI